MANLGTVLVLTGLFVGIVFGIVVSIVGVKLWRRGKALIIFIDPNTRQLRPAYHRVKQGTLQLKQKTIMLDGNAKHGGRASGWIIDPTTGWNYRAPTRAESLDQNPVLAVLEPSGPESYYHATRRNAWTQIIRAGEDPEKNNIWVALGVIGLLALFAVLASLVYIISKLQSGAPGGMGV